MRFLYVLIGPVSHLTRQPLILQCHAWGDDPAAVEASVRARADRLGMKLHEVDGSILFHGPVTVPIPGAPGIKRFAAPLGEWPPRRFW